MEAFSSTAYIESELLGLEKASMTYPFRCLLNDKIDLSRYGDSVQHIYFAPIVSDKLNGITDPYCRYLKNKKELEVRFKIEHESKPLQADASTVF